MGRRTPVYVVCSPLHRVGKTFVSRLLMEFLKADDHDAEAFDLNSDTPALVDFLPDCTVPAGLGDTPAQMALFDRLIAADGVAKVVDLGQEAFARFFDLVAQVGFVAEARRSNVQLVTLFLASPGPTSVRAYVMLQQRFPGMVLAPVHNEGLVRAPNRDLFPRAGGASLPLRVPPLAPGVLRLVNRPGFSFGAFRRGETDEWADSYRHELESWMKRVFIEFRELELRLLLESLRLSLQH